MNFVKENLATYIPALVRLADGQYFPWDKIDQLFLKKLADRDAANQESSIVVEASIFDLIISIKKQETVALGLMSFLQRLFDELDQLINPSERILIQSTVKHLLLSFDSKYLNYLGELAVLNNILKSKAYTLIALEAKLPNGKSLDFTFQHNETQRIVLVEIVNIHLDSRRVDADDECIRRFLTKKLSEKVEVKLAGLTERPSFQLIPVIWGSWEDVKVYSNFFRSKKLDLPNVMEPVSYLTYSDGSGYYEHRFGSVSTLFKDN